LLSILFSDQVQRNNNQIPTTVMNNTNATVSESKEVVFKGKEGLEDFLSHLAPLAVSIETPCEGFAVIQFGGFKGGEGHIKAASLVLLKAGGEHPQHKHDKSDATFHFVSGEGNVVLGPDQKKVPYEAGTVIEVPRGMLHGFEAHEDGLMLATQKGESIIAADGTMDIEYVDRRCFSEHGTVGG
jgi:quercetin dioxygenase-like cupin family protein